MDNKEKQKLSECSCAECAECCKRNPGWFGSISEIKGAAILLNMSVKDFATEYLIQEWWAGEDEGISIPAPRRNFNRSNSEDYNEGYWEDEKLRNGRGFVKASWGYNLISNFPCIFFINAKCLIHKSKPKECRETFACRKGNFKGRESLLSYWGKHQSFIEKLTDEESK